MKWKLAFSFGLPGLALVALGALAGGKPTYENDVKPLFQKYTCVDCHNPQKIKKTKVDLTTYETAMKDVKAGDVDASKIVKLISQKKMPPKKASKPVSDEDLAVIRAWIAAGAAEK